MSKNGIAWLSTKEEKQTAKLDIAAAKRQGRIITEESGTYSISGTIDPTKTGYRTRNNYDITQLPTHYTNNDIVDNQNPYGLIEGRPWIAKSYSIGSIPSSIDEGNPGTIDVTTVGVEDNTILYWTIETNPGDFIESSGSFTITSNAGSFTVTPTVDYVPESGETFTIAIRTDSISGSIVATSDTITINDTNNLVLSGVNIVSQSPFSGGGNSYFFNGSGNSTITIGGSSDWAFGNGDFTVEWFQYETDNNSFPRIFHRGGAYPAQEMGVSIESGTFYAWFKSATNFGSAGTYKNIWTHFAVVRSNGTLTVYKNGTQLGSSSSNSTNFTQTSSALVIGRETNGAASTQFGGYITNFRWIKGLAVYTGTFTVPTSALSTTAAANPYGGSNTAAISAGYTKLLLVP